MSELGKAAEVPEELRQALGEVVGADFSFLLENRRAERARRARVALDGPRASQEATASSTCSGMSKFANTS